MGEQSLKMSFGQGSKASQINISFFTSYPFYLAKETEGFSCAATKLQK